jgi:hypothetical protein
MKNKESLPQYNKPFYNKKLALCYDDLIAYKESNVEQLEDDHFKLKDYGYTADSDIEDIILSKTLSQLNREMDKGHSCKIENVISHIGNLKLILDNTGWSK